MNTIIRRAGSLLAALALVGMANGAQAQGEVTVGGTVEVIGGASDNGYDGLSRGLFSRINVGYTNTLDNGLEISGSISYQVNQRGSGSNITPADLGLQATEGGTVMTADDAMLMDMPNSDMMSVMTTASPHASTNYAPDILSLSVGGGFGTVSLGAHAPASCAMLPRPIAFVPGGVNATWYTLFTKFNTMNGVFTESNYCGTSEALSYATPGIGGLSAMITYAPNMEANQGTTVANASKSATNKPDYVAIAGTFNSDMGGMNLSIGASYQTSGDDMRGGKIDAQAVAGTVGFGAATVGFAWFSNGGGVYDSDANPQVANYVADGDVTGYTFGAKYSLGALTPAITYSVQENDRTKEEETALVAGVGYAVGGGLTVFVEYMSLDEDGATYTTPAAAAAQDDTLLMAGATVSF